MPSADRPSRPLRLTREQILAFRRQANGLGERAALSPATLRRAAWAGLQDSMPRAAVLSLHARVSDVTPAVLEHPSLIQVWGPRYSVYAAAAEDRAVFTLGRWPDTGAAQRRASRLAEQLATTLNGRRERYDDVGTALGINPNALRYATTTGTVLIRWDGARSSLVWTVPAPEVDPAAARSELARRHLHVFGPATAATLATWAGMPERLATTVLERLAGELTPVVTPVGPGWILAGDEPAFAAAAAAAAAERERERERSGGVRLLPSGDAFTLVWGPDRGLLIPDERERADLWPSRVWPGAILLDGEIIGTWRRADTMVSLRPWRALSPPDRERIAAEATSLPIPSDGGGLQVAWEPSSG